MGSEVNKSTFPSELPMLLCVSKDVLAPAFTQVPMRSQEDVEPTSHVSSQHGLPGLCPTGVTGNHPMGILPRGTELEQRTKFFPQFG